MKFSDMPYERINEDQIIKNLKELTESAKNALSADEQMELIRKEDQISSEIETMSSIAYVRYTANTTDEYYKKEQEYNDNIGPKLHSAEQEFLKVIAASPFRSELEQKIGTMFFTKIDFERKGFSSQIVELLQEEGNLASQYQSIMGAAKISFDGGIYNLSQMGKFSQSTERSIRKAAWEATGKFFDSKQEELDTIYDKLVKNRTAQAKKLGYESYVDLAYIRHKRCYGVKDVQNFRAQVLEDLVPIVCKLKKQQSKRIGISNLTYYDDNFQFADGNATPFGTPEDIMEAGKKMYTEMSPETAEFIKTMFDMDLFDVVAKPGKMTGGYCIDLSKYKTPFIFSNFNGTAGDVDVLTHEAGHAFASYTAARNIEFDDLRSPSMEGCETHSMSMEFFAAPWYESFFQDQTDKYEYSHLAGALIFIPYGCMVDHFQEIVYSHPELTPEERNQEWLRLDKMYRPYLDIAGLPCFSRGAGWQRQLHFYTHPYYYIDYCLAQTVALQFWAEIEEDWKMAWAKYKSFVIMGGTKTFLELVEEAGLKSPMKDGCLKAVMERADDWLNKHMI